MTDNHLTRPDLMEDVTQPTGRGWIYEDELMGESRRASRGPLKRMESPMAENWIGPQCVIPEFTFIKNKFASNVVVLFETAKE
jgi:hypothetical protein